MNKIEHQFTSVKGFFNDGISFPQIVSKLYGKPIPNINENIKSSSDTKNNEITLNFLKEQDPYYNKFANIRYIGNKIDLLKTLFTRTYFIMTINEVFNKSNLILISKNIQYKSPKDIFCGKFLLELLNIVTNGKIETKNSVNEIADFKSIIIPSLEKAEVPLVINQYSFNFNQPDYFMIQIQIIFEIYKKIIKKILTKPINVKNQTKNIRDPTFNTIQFIPSNQPYPYNCYVNIINFILNKNLIKDVYDLYKGDVNKLITLVSHITAKTFEFTSFQPDQIVAQILSELQIQKKYNLDDKNDFFDFIKTLFHDYYFSIFFWDKVLTCFFNILIDYEKRESLTFIDFFNSKGYEFFIIIHRLIINRFKILKRDIIPSKNNLSFDQLKQVFDRFNIPFVLCKDSFNVFDIFVFKFQLKIIYDLFYNDYANELLNYKQEQNREQEPILSMINVVGRKYGLRFDSLDSLKYENNFQFFVESLLETTLSDHIDIKPNVRKDFSFQNIKLITNYLKTQKKIINTIQLDFYNSLETIKLLCETLLRLYFLKMPKNKLIERCHLIIGKKIPIQSYKDFNNVGIYFHLLHFINNSNLHCNDDFSIWSTNDLINEFKKAQVEKIIDDRCILQPISSENYIFYQLQIYFDRLDYVEKNIKPSLKVVEILLSSINALNDIKNKIIISKKIDLSQISYNIKVKRAYKKRKIGEINYEQLVESFNYRLKSDKKIPSIPFDEIIEELKIVEIKKRNEFKDVQTIKNFIKNFDQKDFQALYKLSYNRILKTDNQFDLSIYIDFEKFKNLICNIESCTHSLNQKIFKFYIYNEKIDDWEFNEDEFEKYMKTYQYDINSFYTGIILYLNTSSNDLCNFNFDLHEDLFDHNQISIYAFRLDGLDKKPSTTHPIYLFLHVPFVKMNLPNIEIIIMKIYLYLFSISNFQIVLLNKNTVDKQIITTKVMYDIQKNWIFKSKNKSQLIFIFNNNTINNPNNKIIRNDLKNSFNNIFPGIDIFEINFILLKKNFYQDLDYCINNHSLSYHDIYTKLKNYSKFDVCDFYIKLSIQPPNIINNNLETFALQRINQLVIHKDPNFDINDEFVWIPNFDLDLLKKYQFIIYNKLKSHSLIFDISNYIKVELSNYATNYTIYLKEYYQNEVFITPDKFSFIHESFKVFLNEVFENIIKSSCFSLISHLIYKDCLYILNQIQYEFSEKINLILSKYAQKINERGVTVQRNFNDDFQRSTRYIMKEVENIKEIEVIVKLNGEIKDEIEQDF